MATGTDKFLNYNGLVKLISLIKSKANSILSDLLSTTPGKGASLVGYDKTNTSASGTVGGAIKDILNTTIVKSITGYGNGTPSSTSGVNDTKNKLEGTYTTGNLDGTGTNTTTNKFTYIDTTYGTAVADSKDGLLSKGDKAKLDGVATGAQVNVIEHIKLEGASGDLSITSKRVTIPKVTTSADGIMLATDKTKLDNLDDAAATNKGSSLVGYGKSIGGSTRTTVTDALDALNTAVANAGKVDDVMQDGESLVTDKIAYIPHDVILVTSAFELFIDDVESTMPAEEYTALVSAMSENKIITTDTGRYIALYDDGNKIYATFTSEDAIKPKFTTISVRHSDKLMHIEETFSSTTVGTLITTALASYVPTSRTINGKALSSNVTLKSQDIGLTTNISVDGTSKSNVQDALTALNTLAAANKSAISTLQSGGLKREIISNAADWPTGTAIKDNVIYMILASIDPLNSGDPSTSATTAPYGTNNNSYNEYMYINNAWERIGSTEVNLDIDPITDDEIDTAWSTTVAAA